MLGTTRRISQPLTVSMLRLYGADDGCLLPPRVDDRHRFAAPLLTVRSVLELHFAVLIASAAGGLVHPSSSHDATVAVIVPGAVFAGAVMVAKLRALRRRVDSLESALDEVITLAEGQCNQLSA